MCQCAGAAPGNPQSNPYAHPQQPTNPYASSSTGNSTGAPNTNSTPYAAPYASGGTGHSTGSAPPQQAAPVAPAATMPQPSLPQQNKASKGQLQLLEQKLKNLQNRSLTSLRQVCIS